MNNICFMVQNHWTTYFNATEKGMKFSPPYMKPPLWFMIPKCEYHSIVVSGIQCGECKWTDWLKFFWEVRATRRQKSQENTRNLRGGRKWCSKVKQRHARHLFTPKRKLPTLVQGGMQPPEDRTRLLVFHP